MYDPLRHQDIGCNADYPASYWASEYTPSIQTSALIGQQDTDIAVIGGGYTGLSCAYHLASKQQQVTLLEANQVGWGCSGRNGGFVLAGTGRLSFAAMQKRWGNQTAQAIYQEYHQAIETVKTLIEAGNIDCDQQLGGYLKVAHRQGMVKNLQQQARYLQQTFNDGVQFIDAEQLKQHYLISSEAHGALLYPYCFGVHPLKLANGYAQLAKQSGATIHQGSPVVSIDFQQGKHILHTPQGQLRANKLVIATNGYSRQQLHPAIDGRHFPVLSSIIVSAPLSAEQQQRCGLRPGIMVMDTRALKYYYRLLPDGRLLFGGRGAISGKNANQPVFRERLYQAMLRTLPQLGEIAVDYFWSGWVSVSLDDFPRIYQHDNQVYYAMGYCGSGLSFATQAGKRLAEKVMAQHSDLPQPFSHSPLPTFPLAPLRRVGLWGFYHYGRFKDAWL